MPPALLLAFPPDILLTELCILLFVIVLLVGVPAKVLDIPRRIGYWILLLFRGLKLIAKELVE